MADEIAALLEHGILEDLLFDFLGRDIEADSLGFFTDDAAHDERIHTLPFESKRLEHFGADLAAHSAHVVVVGALELLRADSLASNGRHVIREAHIADFVKRYVEGDQSNAEDKNEDYPYPFKRRLAAPE